MKVVWLPSAESNLDEIFDFYAAKSLTIANAIIAEIIKDANILKQHPKAGRIVPSFVGVSLLFRSLVTYKGLYKIIYYIEGGYIYVYAVIDCRQNPEQLEKVFKIE